MADTSQLAFVDVKGGMNAADPPHKINTSQVARMVNCAIVNGLPATRFGMRVVPISGTAAEFIATENIQGSIFFNPAKGQGGIVMADENPRLALACGGRKFTVHLNGRKTRATAAVTDITNGLLTNGQLHTVWWSAWENLLIAQDGSSNAFVWNAKDPAFFSSGYDTVTKLRSKIPNGGSVMCYAHGRGVVVVNSRYILVGDNLHRTDLSSSNNLLDFVEQAYWATGQYFLPPSSMGNITAAAILAQRNTQHGHGDTMFHCEDGVFSVDLNVYPRSKWSETPMVKHALLQAGASGPYAIAIQDGDQLYRTRKGLQTLRSTAATSLLLGSPDAPLSAEVGTWLDGDYPRWLRFASVSLWDRARRLVMTTGPIVQGRYRWHRGFVVRNNDPNLTEQSEPGIWEGLWTFPPQTGGVIQFVNGLFDGEQRQFAWTRGDDLRNRLVELNTAFRNDILEDGTERRIRAQLITRAIDAGKWWERREYTHGRLYLRNIFGALKWGVWFRSGESPQWRFWRAGTATNAECDVTTLLGNRGRTIPIPLGTLPSDLQCDTSTKTNESRSIQFLVRWEGYCQLEGLKLSHGSKDLEDDAVNDERTNIVFKSSPSDDYDDFEFSETDDALWITSEAL